MQVRDAKLLYDSNVLIAAHVEPMRNNGGWSVRFTKTNKALLPDDKPIYLQSKRLKYEIRIFKSINAACMAANKVGFERITLHFHSQNTS